MSEIEAMVNAGAEGAKAGKAGFDLVGKVLGPALTRRQATADAQAEVQGVLAKRLADHIESNPLDPDILDTVIACGGKMNLINLAKIVQKAEFQLTNEAMPALITDDWAANFRDKARNCSDEEMANLWAQLLAGEANNPNSRSRKAVNILADMDKPDAELFSALCRFRLITFNFSNLRFSGSPPPPRSRFNTAPAPPLLVVLDAQHAIYKDQGIDFQSLTHLEGLGLIKVLPQGYNIGPGKFAYTLDTALVLSCGNPIQMGVAYFTTAGSQLSELCFPLNPPAGFADYLTDVWQRQGVSVGNDLNEVIVTRAEIHSIDPITGQRTLIDTTKPQGEEP